MLINGWDIADARGKQWNVVIGHHSVSSNSEWTKGSPVPVMLKNEIGFKTAEITMLVYGDNRDDILNNRSIILSHLLSPVDLELDGFSHKFCGIMTKCEPEETVMNRWHRLTLSFNCFEYADEIVSSFSGSTTITMENPGDILTPLVIEIVPQIGAATMTMTGICRDAGTGEDLPVTIKNLVTGEKVILDGETGLFTKNGALTGNIEIWQVPTLLPGENKITIDNNRMDLKLSFCPRFM